MLLPERDPAALRVEGAAHRLEHDRLLAEQVGDELRALLVVDTEHLQDARVGQEGAGALAVEGAQLVDVLHDRPKLDPVARHKPHGAFYGLQVAQGGELVE